MDCWQAKRPAAGTTRNREPQKGLPGVYHRHKPDTSGNPGFEDEPVPISAAQLASIKFSEPDFVISDILPTGVHLLAGKPKKGKSWMALGMCIAVATGGYALGDKPARAGSSLYLSLEDNPRRLVKRLRKVLGGRDMPEKMYLETRWWRLDEGGAERLDHWLEHHRDTRLVVIDTLAKIRKPSRGGNVYSEDYSALEQLIPIAEKHNVAIVVVHHLRKAAASDPMDEINASMGLTGGVDGFLILRRTPGSKGPTLFVDGRDIEEPTEYALRWDADVASWTIEGDAEEVHLSKERTDILLVLNRARRYMTPSEVTDALGPQAKRNNVKYLMWTMLGDGQLVKNDKGAYYPTNPTNPANPTNPTNPTNRTNRPPDRVIRLVEDPEPTNRTFDDTYAENGHPVSEVSAVSEVGELLRNPPDWLVKQLAKCRENPETMTKPTASAIATKLYGTAARWHEVKPILEECLRKLS
jgi:hypothetical protein